MCRGFPPDRPCAGAHCDIGLQVMKTRLEADEVAAQLERCDKENKILKDEMNKEIEAVKLSFLPPPPPSSDVPFSVWTRGTKMDSLACVCPLSLLPCCCFIPFLTYWLLPFSHFLAKAQM